MGPGFPVRHFQIGADHAGSWRWNAHAGEEFRGSKDIFPRRILARQDEKIGGGQAASAAAIESVGGTLECFYFAFGDTDVFLICDLPDDASAAALSMLVNSSGAVRGTMTPLMTPEELDEAAAKSPSYRPPGVQD